MMIEVFFLFQGRMRYTRVAMFSSAAVVEERGGGLRITVGYAICWLCGLATAMAQWEGQVGLLAAAAVSYVLGRHLLSGRMKQFAICVGMLVCAVLYGHWQQQMNVSALPEAPSSMQLTGIIASPIKQDGDRIRFELKTILVEIPENAAAPASKLSKTLFQKRSEKVMVTIKLMDKTQLKQSEGWSRGDHATLTGELALPSGARNFDQFDYAKYLRNRGVHRILTIDGLEQAVVASSDKITLQSFLGLVEGYRTLLANRVSLLFPGEQSGFMQGMLIGVRADLAGGLFNQFSRLGLTHIIAISGLHVAIVVGGWLLTLRIFKVARETALLSALFLIPIYVLLSGASPSVIRSGMMAMIAVYAARNGWLKDALQILAIAIIAMTVWNPFYLYDVGFQLSFAVTAGLIGGTSAMRSLFPRKPNGLYNAIAVTLVAQLVSFPLTIYYFNQFSLLSALANLLLVPVFSLLVLPAGYIALMVSYLYMPLGSWIAVAVGGSNRLCFWLIEQLDRLSGTLMIWKSPSLGMVMLYYAILYVLAAGVQRVKSGELQLFPVEARQVKRILIGGSAALLLWLTVSYHADVWRTYGMVSFLDVGQGDAMLIRTPEHQTILIDGGGTLRFQKNSEQWRARSDPYEVGEDLLVPLLKKRGIRQIDYLIVTHADTDHIGGLLAVLSHIPVKRLLFNGTLKESETASQLFRLALARQIPLYPVTAGRSLEVDDHTRIDFLYPPAFDKVHYASDQNNASTVFLLHMYAKHFLFTGDMGVEAERHIIAELKEPLLQVRVDVLKIAHHGSKNSTSEEWLNYWQPSLAVISVGLRNVYRHPSEIVMDRLSRHHTPVLRTDLHGEVQVNVRSEEPLTYRSFLDNGK
jgi:competence protein ComEC